MKKVILMMVAFLSMTAVQAQEVDNKQARGPKKMTPAQVTERMADRLKLTDEQKTKVLALNTKYEKVIGGPSMRGPRPQKPDGETGATAQGEQKRPQRPEMTDAQKKEMKERFEQRQAYNKELKEILTDEQYKQYEKMRPGRHGHHGHRGHRGLGGPRPDFQPMD